MSDEGSFRESILATIRQFPGIHLRGLVKHFDTSTALARYHVEALIEAGEVRAYEIGGFRRYFPQESFGDLSPTDRKILHLLRQERPLAIVLALLELGPMQHRDHLEVVGGAKGTLTYQIDKLVEAGVVAKIPRGPERGFHLVDEEHVRDLLRRYEPVPHVLDQVHDLWEDLFVGHRHRKGRR